GRYYFLRRLADENRSSVCTRAAFAGKDEVVIDPKTLGDESLSIGQFDVSDDGRLLAYAVRRGGEDEEEVRLFDLEKRELLQFRLPRARYFSLTITPDGSGIYYVRYTTEQGSRVFYHRMGAAEPDREVFGSQYGPEALTQSWLSDDGRYLVLKVQFGV